MRERQFHNYFNQARKMEGDASQNLLILLENRFDNVVYRLGLADSRDQARQLVTHGHFLINDKKVKIPSYQVKAKEKITIKEKSKNNSFFDGILREISQKTIPEWLSFDAKTKIGIVLDRPVVKDLGLGPDATLTVEFYSR